jgi:hypothetical protein
LQGFNPNFPYVDSGDARGLLGVSGRVKVQALPDGGARMFPLIRQMLE